MFRFLLLVFTVFGMALFGIFCLFMVCWGLALIIGPDVPDWMPNPTAVGIGVAVCLLPLANKGIYKLSLPICRQIERWPDSKIKQLLIRDIDSASSSE